MKNVLSLEEAMFIWKNKKFLAKGKRGFVYVAQVNNRKFLLKTANSSSDAVGTILKEAKNNQILNGVNVGPRFLYYDDKNEYMIRDFVEGKSIFDWMGDNKNYAHYKDDLLSIIMCVLDQCRRMDLLGFNKYEMTNPHKDLLVTSNLDVFIIDFERCRFTIKPKNVTQFCQFLVKGRMRNLLAEACVLLEREKISFLAENYKKSLSDSDFNKIKEEIRKAFL